jgi:hypothetical protein
MKIEIYRNAIGFIEIEKKSTFGREALNRIWPKLKDLRDESLENVCDKIILEHKFLPTAGEFLRLVEAEDKAISQQQAITREVAAEKEKREYTPISHVVACSELGQNACSAIIALLGGDINMREYLATCLDICKKHNLDTDWIYKQIDCG